MSTDQTYKFCLLSRAITTLFGGFYCSHALSYQGAWPVLLQFVWSVYIMYTYIMEENIITNIDSYKGAYSLNIDVDKSRFVPTVILMFPNGTEVVIRGDEDVVKQIVNRLDGMVVEYA